MHRDRQIDRQKTSDRDGIGHERAVCEAWPGFTLVLGPLGGGSLGPGGTERSPPEGGGLYSGPECTRVPETRRMPNAIRRKESSHKTLKEVGRLEAESESGQVPSPDKVHQAPNS